MISIEEDTALKWLQKIFQMGKASPDRREEEEEPATLALSHVEDWLRDRSDKPQFEMRVRSIYATIERMTIDLEKKITALEAAEPDDEVPPRLLKAGTAARENVSRQMRLLSSKLAPPAGADFRSAKEYHSSILKQLQNTVQKFGRAQRYTAALFPEEVEAINSDLGAISRHLKDLGDYLIEEEANLGRFGEAAELAAQIRGRRRLIEALGAEISEEEEHLALLRDKERLHQKEIESWTKSDEGKRMLEEKKSLEQKLRERDQIEMSMGDLVSPLTKAISRIVKQDSSDRIALQHRELFQQLSASPARALEGDISGALLELKSKVDLLGLRDKKRERILEQIDHLLEDRPLEVLKARHSALHQEIEEIGRSLSKSDRETGRLKGRRDLVRQKIPALEAGLQEKRRNLAALEERLAADLADLEERIEEIAEGLVEIDIQG